jgi:hypothetical protein
MDFLSPNARSVLLSDRQCTATSKTTGERCRRASALGQFVCDMHGAKAPLSIQAAKERMAMLLEPALEVLYRATRSAPPCEHCGRSDADRDPSAIRAAQIILDRAGFGPSATMQVIAAPDPHADLSDDELLAHFERVLASARSRSGVADGARSGIADGDGARSGIADGDGARAALPAAIDGDVYTVPEEDVDGAERGVNPVGDAARVDAPRANGEAE